MIARIKNRVGRIVKNAAEQLASNGKWIEQLADVSEVAEFMRAVHPRAMTTQLIRVGGVGDGGYLLPDDMEDVKVCISPGVSDEISFDLAMADRGIDVLMADASVDGPTVQNDRFHFVKKHLDVFEDEAHMRLESLGKLIHPELDGDRILQMDIESAEYRVLLDASDETLKSFRIMVIEFHKLDRIFAKFAFELIKATFDKLLRSHHVVHIHPNNAAAIVVRAELAVPPVMEFTFYRKDRAVLDDEAKLRFPHPLDNDNVQNRAAVSLPECWQ